LGKVGHGVCIEDKAGGGEALLKTWHNFLRSSAWLQGRRSVLNCSDRRFAA
jgi:hypothetical protein